MKFFPFGFSLELKSEREYLAGLLKDPLKVECVPDYHSVEKRFTPPEAYSGWNSCYALPQQLPGPAQPA